MKVFWSWQDDSPGGTNRHFIKAALEDAIQALEGDYEFEDAERPSLDHDTKGVGGAREIVPTIMAKVARSVIFVADVTPVAKTASGKAVPNPNVMVELGWSLNKPGDGRQIYILNTADGWAVEGLPFDIRHRRVLTYSLSSGADAKTRQRTRKSLVKDLTSAIRTNLAEHLEEKAQSTEIVGTTAEPDEVSIWQGGRAGFRHHDTFGHGRWTHVAIQGGPRAYLRVIPSGWKSSKPSIAQIRDLPNEEKVWPWSRHLDGSFGATKEGYVLYWIASPPDEPRLAEDVTMYFQDTGEFWNLHGGSVVTRSSGERSVDLAEVFKGWSTQLRRIHALYDRLGALPARRVEVGFTGFEDVRFPGGWSQMGQPARRDRLIVKQTRRDWSESGRLEAFLLEALGEIFELFGVDRLDTTEAATFIRANDPYGPRP
jgi:hypothetical protein